MGTQGTRRRPPPRPRLRRSSPAPAPRGRGPYVAISGEQPCPALLRDLPVRWTVWISPRGEGPTGRGNSFPLPCLSRSRHLAPCQPYPARPSAGRLPIHLCRHPPPRPRLRGWISIRFCRHPPPRPRLRRSSPAPAGGVGSAWRYQGSSCIRGGAGEQPYPGWSWWAAVPGFSPGSPHAVDRGDIAIGGGADGEGELVPPPLSPTLQPSYFSPASLARASVEIPIPFYRHPHPTRAFGAPPPPAPRGRGSACDIRGAAVSGVEPVGRCARRSALCAGPRGEARSPFFSGLSPRGRPWRLSPRGGRPCPAPIRTDARPSPPSPACFRIFQVR